MNYYATIRWTKSTAENFIDGKYSRVHQWAFDGGMQFNASASPHVVPVPMSDPAWIDPEEAFIASLSSCHMLYFLFFCSRQKFIVSHYEDKAEGVLGEGPDGKQQMLSVILHPSTRFEGEHIPSEETLHRLHEQAHESCFIANSVKTKVEVLHQVEKTQS